LEAELAALKAAEKAQSAPPLVVSTDDEHPVQSQELSAGTAAVTAVMILVSANLIMIMAMGLFGSRYAFTYFWPAELALSAGGLFYLMKPIKNIWLTIPAGILLGLSALFFFSQTFDAWSSWAYIWPLVVFLVMGVIWKSIKWANHGEPTRLKAYQVGHRFSRLSYGFTIIVGIVSLASG